MKINTELTKSLVSIEDSAAIQYYENWANTDPKNIEAYSYLGLTYLIQGDEEVAQLTWFEGLSQLPEHTLLEAIRRLIEILQAEAERQSHFNRLPESLLIRLHIHEIQPKNLNNIISYIYESICLEQFNVNILEEWEVYELLKDSEAEIEKDILGRFLEKILMIPIQQSLDVAEACLTRYQSLVDWANVLIESSHKIDSEHNLGYFAASILELCLKHDPDNTLAFSYLPHFYINCGKYQEAIQSSQRFYDRSITLEQQFCSNCLLLQTLMKAGVWEKVPEVSDRHKAFIKQLIDLGSTQLELGTIQFLTVYSGSLAYLQDNLSENRLLQNKVGQLFLKNLKANVPQIIKPVYLSPYPKERRIRVGYIASTLRNHSVGWLSRWLFKYHDQESFEIYIYLAQQKSDHPFFQRWFAPYVKQYTVLGNDIGQAGETIRKDELDILVDLDSFTLGFTATIMALKTAPIQVTWLGCDASGIPGIDYFITDPYVLPERAQDHYQEKLWQLPHTYIAVEGFETELPTIRRSDLGISSDAMVYLSAQAGAKRDPKTLRLQLKIIKAVPNSYFLLKGLSEHSALQKLVTAIAQEEGVPLERIHFLPLASNEYQHRANLEIADIILDTYPYNGATTTLEALWMGIPLVTRVGDQFAARNSYAFLINAGVTEGIALTDEEYIEWGIRFGYNESLRSQVTWTLKQSRKTSPLWNVKQFTHDMENAYRAMISNHMASSQEC